MRLNRSQHIPWEVAGRVSEQMADGDDVVRRTGWVFNNATGDDLTLADFVSTGNREVPSFLRAFGLLGPELSDQTLVEIGSGIGRMTCAFTRHFGSVTACDLDKGFLERCYETVGRFGIPERLRTVAVADGRTLDIASDSADVAFSYITLQHCEQRDALELAREAVRVVRPGGTVMLNFRGPAVSDPIVLPVGALLRNLYRSEALGRKLSHKRLFTRLAWQASRIHPDAVTGVLSGRITDVRIWTNPRSKLAVGGAEMKSFEGVNDNHWWLVATVV